jgi:hypothetical protein
VPGSVLTDGQILSLSAGTSAAILFRSGAIVRLKGPFDGRLDTLQPAAGRGGALALVQALQSRGVDAAIIGATRSLPPASIYGGAEGADVSVDTRHSAIYCINDNDTVWLKGGPAARGGPIRLQREDSQRALPWPDGATQIPWPDDLTIEDGDRFDVRVEHGGAPATLVFRRMPPALSTEAWVAAGILLGCRDQADPGLQRIRTAVEQEIAAR